MTKEIISSQTVKIIKLNNDLIIIKTIKTIITNK